MEKQELRDSIGIDSFESCMCDQLELWNLSPFLPPAGNTPSAQGRSIGINERKPLANNASKVDGARLQ